MRLYGREVDQYVGYPTQKQTRYSVTPLRSLSMEKEMPRGEVLIIGAGPTGLVLALWLTKLGVKVRIIDKTAEPGTTSRALAVQARTLELYRQLDLAEAVVARGHRVPAVNLWVRGEAAARISFENVGSGLTPYPFLHIFPQDQHERLLIERLEALGVAVERRTELIQFTNGENGIIARLREPDGQEVDCAASYIAGCEERARSCARLLAPGFPAAPTGRSSTSPTSRQPAPP
jgi:2-polyprenyl-6-methoxyphenol hydroxylase-like FAD-dependent oxidoreductase